MCDFHDLSHDFNLEFIQKVVRQKRKTNRTSIFQLISKTT